MGYRGSLITCLWTETEWATGGSSGATAGSKSSKKGEAPGLVGKPDIRCLSAQFTQNGVVQN